MNSIIPKFLRGDTIQEVDGPEITSKTPGAMTKLPAGGHLPPVGFQAPSRNPLDFAPPANRLSEEAGRAAQHVLDLETALQLRTQERDAARNHISLFEQANELLHEELKNALSERAYYERRCMRLLTYLEQIGDSAIKAARDAEPPLIADTVQAARDFELPDRDAPGHDREPDLATGLRELEEKLAETPENLAAIARHERGQGWPNQPPGEPPKGPVPSFSSWPQPKKGS